MDVPVPVEVASDASAAVLSLSVLAPHTVLALAIDETYHLFVSDLFWEEEGM